VTVDVARPSIFDADRPAPAPLMPTTPTPAGPAPATAPLASVRRRLAAWLVDLTLIVMPSAAVALTQARVVVPDPAAPFAPDPSWIMVAGTGYRWTAGGASLTGAAGLLAALIVLILIPANTSGWTPGLRLVRLRVLTTAGTRAGLHHHLVRTVFGLADLAPFAIPGLLGWYLAHRSPLHQRLGDRMARTMVVDHRHPERPVDPGATRRPRSGPLADPSGPRPTSGPLPAGVTRRQAPLPTIRKAAAGPHNASPTAVRPAAASGADAGTPRTPAASSPAASRWRVEQIDAPAGPTLPPILPDTLEVDVPAPSHRRTSGPIPRRGSPLAGPGTGTGPADRRPDPRTAQSARLTVSVPRRGPAPGSDPEPELVPEWSERWQAWVVRDAASGLLFRHDAATGDWLPI